MQNSRIELPWIEDFNFLSDEEKLKFRRVSFKKGDAVYAQNIRFIILLSGAGKLSYYQDGKEFILNFVKGGNYILLDDEVTFRITKDCQALEINICELEELFDNKKLAMSLANFFIKVIMTQRSLIKDLVFLNTDKRLKDFLENIAQIEDEKKIAVLPFSITTLAEMMGSSRQNVSTALNNLIKNGEIKKLSRKKLQLNY